MALSCRGFKCGAVHAGIKKKPGVLDLAIIACDRPATAAAVFTRNKVVAAPVVLSRRALKKSGGVVRAVVVNSGNANACTGTAGMADARRMASHTAAALGVPPGEVLVASTGVIGAPLPMVKIDAGVDALAPGLRARGFEDFAAGILTTDKRAKTARRTVTIGGKRVTLIGCTKGAGMIAPNMATTLSFVLTDAHVGAAPLRAMLGRAADLTYNAITVDGDTSTNDMILVMASGAAGNRAPRGADARRFEEALTALLDDLASQLMRDGEGVHHVVRVRVEGARSQRGAALMARSIATSPLVKTAIAGGDPNWGRILAAAGYAGAPMNPARARLWIGDVLVVDSGIGVPGADLEARAAAVMQKPAYELRLDLGQGKGAAACLACDLSHEYVSINADYRS